MFRKRPSQTSGGEDFAELHKKSVENRSRHAPHQYSVEHGKKKASQGAPAAYTVQSSTPRRVDR